MAEVAEKRMVLTERKKAFYGEYSKAKANVIARNIK